MYDSHAFAPHVGFYSDSARQSLVCVVTGLPRSACRLLPLPENVLISQLLLDIIIKLSILQIQKAYFNTIWQKGLCGFLPGALVSSHSKWLL